MTKIRPRTSADTEIINTFLYEHWGSNLIISRGKSHDGNKLPAFLAISDDKLVGLITYDLVGDSCEIVSLDSINQGSGIGTKLIQAVIEVCKNQKCSRLWLITTNDNLDALRFYQRRDFTIAAIHKNAIDASRKLKPSIPLTGNFGIPIRDEIELEINFR